MIFNPPLLTGLVASGLLLLASQSHAQCQEPALPPGTLGYAACKDWPAQAGVQIRALASAPDNATGDAQAEMFDLLVTLVDTGSQQVKASYTQQQAISSDAVAFDGLAVDTARYQVGEGVRAFGIRSHFSHESMYNPFASENLSLFVVQGQALRPLLSDLNVYQYGGESEGRCQGQFSTRKRTLAMATTRSHGFADLIVKTTLVKRQATQRGEQCLEQNSPPQVSQVTLRYDGQRYVVPQGLRDE